ncbi:MAG: ABC transporter ATP-binding protein [Nitrospirota bacterium]
MSSDDIAIRVSDLGKCYQIYDNPRDRLKQFLLPRLQRLVGKAPAQYFREFWALNDVTFEVKKGETVGIIGRNGSGKSTLLQIICGTLAPTKGTVETRGRIAALLELGSGFNPDFTGRENVYLNAAVLGLSKEEIDARFEDIAAFADIGDFIEQPVKTYSSGMVVRLAFAVQAMVDPDVFVVDEALAVGDEKFQRKCYARLEELKSRGTSILFVSHSSPSIVELCDKTLLLEHGERLMFGLAPPAIQAYQKLIYAPFEEQEALIREYRAADRLGEGSETMRQCSTGDLFCNRTIDTYDPGLVPETTTVYPMQGAEIQSIRILDDEECVVNVLYPGKSYRYEVSGRFTEDLSAIYFGIHIRSISGVVITGQRYPEEGNYIECVSSGQKFRITFRFNMAVLPGVYFCGGGIWSYKEPDCAHRILDAIMFRVVPKGNMKSFGYVDLSSDEPNIEIF